MSVFGTVGGLLGIGGDKTAPQNFGDTKFYDPNRFEYGGQAGLAAQMGQEYGNTAKQSIGQANGYYDQANGLLGRANGFYSQGNYDRLHAMQARQGELGIAGLMAARANGQVPSIAEMAAQRQAGQLAAEQASIAAGARGPAALALAQQQQQAATSQGLASLYGQAQINAAQERQAAEQAALGAYGNIRQGDYQGQQNAYGAAGQAQAGAGVAGGLAQGLNARALGYSGLQNSVYGQQQQGGIEQQRILSGSQAQGQNLNQQNADRDLGFLQTVAGMASGGVSGATMKSDAAAKQNIAAIGGGLVDLGGREGAVLGNGGGSLDVRSTLAKYADMGSAFRPSMGGIGVGGGMPGQVSLGMMSDVTSKQGAAPAGGGLTGQLAQMQPYSYEYKPGMGPPGPNVGPMAQDMLRAPATAVAVDQDPASGLLSLDRDRSLKLALGGVGHLANRQMQTENALAGLLAAQNGRAA